jgi:hypothetical protein
MPHPHVHSPTYAPPVLRASSPASSLGTTYAPDATSFSDTEAELSQAAFEKKWEDKLRLGREFAREWNGDLGEGEDEGDEDGYEGWNGMRAVRDREREGWGREPLLNIGEIQRTSAEDKCNALPSFLPSSRCTPFTNTSPQHRHPRTNPQFPTLPNPPPRTKRDIRTNPPHARRSLRSRIIARPPTIDQRYRLAHAEYDVPGAIGT